MGVAKDDKENSLNVRKVTISDMQAIVSLYNTDQSKKDNSTLTEDFGVPIVLIEHGSSIIGYSSIRLNERNEPEVQLMISDHFKHLKAHDKLVQFTAGSPHYDLSKDNTNSFDSLQISKAIKKLIHWLNLCGLN
jgi:hypothetical protein